MTEPRTQITEYVHAHPGIHFSGLVRALELAPGQVQYHLKQLRSSERVIEEPLYGRTHYYPPEYDSWERSALALLRRETASDIIGVLLTEETVHPKAVASELEIARSTVEWHLDHLINQGLVTKRRNSQNRVTLVLERPDDITRLLRDADPSLAARMVDRFTRLVDQLLSP